MRSEFSVFDLIECKGRNGSIGSLRDKFGLWIAGLVTSAIMRNPRLRRELTASIEYEMNIKPRKPPKMPPVKE